MPVSHCLHGHIPIAGVEKEFLLTNHTQWLIFRLKIMKDFYTLVTGPIVTVGEEQWVFTSVSQHTSSYSSGGHCLACCLGR